MFLEGRIRLRRLKRLDRSRGFGAASNLKLSTTNVDFSENLYQQFQTLRTYRPTRFNLDPEGLAVEGRRWSSIAIWSTFFPSITFHRAIGFFRQIGYSPAVSTIFALLVTECPRRKVLFNGKPWHVATGPRALPQRACTSPAISNFIARRMDSRLAGIAKKLGWTYTRYADDLTFSSAGATARIGYLLARIRHITGDEGFAVNEKKTRVLKRAARQTVTGIVVNAQTSTSRRDRRRLRAIVHNAKKTGPAAQNRSRHEDFKAWMRGMIGFVAMVNPRQAFRLRNTFDSLLQQQ